MPPPSDYRMIDYGLEFRFERMDFANFFEFVRFMNTPFIEEGLREVWDDYVCHGEHRPFNRARTMDLLVEAETALGVDPETLPFEAREGRTPLSEVVIAQRNPDKSTWSGAHHVARWALKVQIWFRMRLIYRMRRFAPVDAADYPVVLSQEQRELWFRIAAHILQLYCCRQKMQRDFQWFPRAIQAGRRHRSGAGSGSRNLAMASLALCYRDHSQRSAQQ